MRQHDLARRFLELHAAPELLLLPNAWDAGSAVIFERAGFEAIGTTSAGISYSSGYPDGQQLPLAELLTAVARIARRISVPLSVDVEAGYGAEPSRIAANVAEVVAAGAVGINLEDGRVDGPPTLVDIQFQCEVLSAVAEVRSSSGVPFVINARTDSYWLGIGDETERLEQSMTRGNAYLAAGADCIFVPGGFGRETIEILVRELAGPLNVIATPACPSPAELEEMGVARLSLGSGPVRAVFGLLRKIASEVRGGSVAYSTAVELSYDEANRLFS
ncbi:MAG TPA: isocitrate lyase/phosphoenolpyruvate mutase family protein [Trueperaceae bacterium]